MSQQACQIDVRQKTQQLLQGPLKHVRAAALAAALMPLAVVAAGSVEPQACSSAGTAVCGIVWYDTNENGIRDEGEPLMADAVVTLSGPGLDPVSTSTNESGVYEFVVPAGTYEIAVQIPPGTQTSPSNVGSTDTEDSDGVPDGFGNSVAPVTLTSTVFYTSNTDFGFSVTPVVQPGTGTPGYWKTHPEAWPVQSITIGGILYTKAQALAFLDTPGKDKTLTMFSSLLSARLNLLVGNDGSCVASTIAAADEWMSAHPAGTGVHAASLAWKLGEPLHRLMDNYNNGMLCAPHRD
jgi:hypothetical protein